MSQQDFTIETGTARMAARLTLPERPDGVVVIVHGPYESHAIEGALRWETSFEQAGLASLTVDLTSGFDGAYHVNEPMRRHVIYMLAQRLVATTLWLRVNGATCSLPIAYFATGLGASAACAAAVACTNEPTCIVCWDGRLDLVEPELLARVRAPMLLLVSDSEHELMADTRSAAAALHSEHALQIVPRAGRMYVDTAAYQYVESSTRGWLDKHLRVTPVVHRAAVAPSAPARSP